jgi:predicted aldo/keto reductase-like oxidoreductase
MEGTCGGNRRRFLQTTAATGAALASANALLAAPEGAKTLPTVTLGKTGQKVTKLGMGTSWTVAPSFVQAALFSGVRYIDTSESYENGQSEKTVGEVLERTKMRKDVYLVTKNSKRKIIGPEAARVYEAQLDASMARLRTDYVDCYYLHGVTGKELATGLLTDPTVKAAFEHLKKIGKIRFCGLSCHDGKLPEILDAAAEAGWIDQVMFKYNFRDVSHDALQRAVDKASKNNLGLVAMKTQGGAASLAKKFAEFQEKGFKKEIAAIKTVFSDERMQVVVSEMTNFTELKENMSAVQDPLTPKEARLLEQHRLATANMYCHGCGHLCETAARGVPVADVLRYLRYYEAYGKRHEARALYQALPPAARAIAEVDLKDVDAACPFGLPVADLLRKADQRLS